MMFTGVPKLGGDLVACSKNVRLLQLQKTRMEETVVDLGIMMQKLQTIQHQLQFSWIHGQHVVIMLLAEAKAMKEKPKKAFADELAKKMAEETTSQHRTAAQFQSKVDSTATQWCAAHEWAQATGAGLKERDIQENTTTTFDDAVKKGCPHYFLLLDIMKDRTSTRPLATSGMDPPGKTKIMSKRLMIIYQNKLFCLMMTLVLLLPRNTCLLLMSFLLILLLQIFSNDFSSSF